MTVRDSLTAATQQTLVLHGERLPSTCGDHFTKCNLTFVTDPSSSTSVLLVPLRRGVALIEYKLRENQTLCLSSHKVLKLPSQINNCQITTLLDLTNFDTSNLVLFGRSIPPIVGLCLNNSGAVDVQPMSISIDFTNISSSSLLPFVDDVLVRLASEGVISNFVFLLDLPQCLFDYFSSLTYYFEGSQVGLFDVAADEQIDRVEKYTLFYEGTNREFICSDPRQLVRISDNVLIVYCKEGSAQLDICRFTISSVEDVKIHEVSDGVPYYCSDDMTSFVTVNGKIVTYNYNSSFSVINRTLPLVTGEEVYIGNCIESGNSEYGSVYFALTTTQGNKYLVDLREDLGENKAAVILEERDINSPSFVPHHVYDDQIVVYNNKSTTVFFNTSCQNPVTIDHRYHLSLVVPGEGVYPCTCSSRALAPPAGPDVNSPSDKEISASNIDAGAIAAGLVCGVLVVSVVVVLFVGVVIYRTTHGRER